MNSTQFVNWMERFVEQHKELERVIDVLYTEIGLDMVDFIDNIGFETYAINAMELALNDDEHWLTYFVWECECDFDRFNNQVEVNEKNVDIHTYEDLYFFIVGRE